MKNGYTPTEYAHSVAIDALIDALHNRNGDFDDLPRRNIGSEKTNPKADQDPLREGKT